METVNERWKTARKELKMNQVSLADALGMSQTQMSSYEKGSVIPLSSIRSFSAICKVRESYLLNGDLPILEPEEEKTPIQVIMEMYNLPPICKSALEEWVLLPEADQQTIMHAIQATIDRYNSE